MHKLTLLSLVCATLLTSAPAPSGPQPPAAPPKRPGVATPGVRIPITKLKPEAVYDFAGAPDWMAVDKEVWVSITQGCRRGMYSFRPTWCRMGPLRRPIRIRT